MESLYADLRAIAASYCGAGTYGTIQPTVIVHEAYLKLAGFEARKRDPLAADAAADPWQNRQHFLAVAATAMRQVVVDHARRLRASKRHPEESGGGNRVFIDLAMQPADDSGRSSSTLDLVELDDALGCLEAADPRAARVVELRFFAGMTVEETAGAMGLSRTSVEVSWRAARAWLLAQLQPDEAGNRNDESRYQH